MGFLSFDEKAWDKVRPSSVKKTGVSEALRAFEKRVPKGVDDLALPADCTEATSLLDTVVDKLQSAKKRFDAKKHEDAIKKVTGWISEAAVRRKIITNHAEKLHEQLTEAIVLGNAELDPYMERVEQAKAQAHDLVSSILDVARKAMLAGGRGDSQTLQSSQKEADLLAKRFEELLASVRHLYTNAVQAAERRLPKVEWLDQAQQTKRGTVVTRCNAIKVKLGDIDDFHEQFGKAGQLVQQAGSKGEDVQASFAKVVSADLVNCQEHVLEVGASETAVTLDLDQVEWRLKEANLPQTDPTKRALLAGESAKWLKDAIGKLKRMESLADRLSKSYNSKIEGYPDYVRVDNPLFQRSMEGMNTVGELIQSKRQRDHPKLSNRTKLLGQGVQQLLTQTK